ncbi:MAG TPA: PD-(D/E)XK nuclease family protein [Candidatus Nanoarchaeia archaeon]|nr:PD-(D/E)XK nuclease family protein [Candidatus Nanoarchaeia archaeon]
MSRLESPSSINTFKQCKRKYFYSYKLNLPRKDTISTLTGKAVHSALEGFFKIDPKNIDKTNYEFTLRQELMHLFNTSWTKALPDLLKLETDKETARQHYQECFSMLNNFINDFLSMLSTKINGLTFQETFEKLKPKTEVYFYSEAHKVHGYIDAIQNYNDEFYILDYKTSSRDEVTEEYELQLAIYGLMFQEKYNVLPHKLGLHFLRHGTKKFVNVTPELIEKAKRECEFIQLNTESNDIKDYDKNPGPLCKWRTGQCSFYDVCFGQKNLNTFIQEENLIQINKDNKTEIIKN